MNDRAAFSQEDDMNVTCKCNRHRLPRGAVLSMAIDGPEERERHSAEACYGRATDGKPQPLEPVQRTAKLRVLD